MIEAYRVATYWGTHRVTVQECARLTRDFFEALAGCDPSLEQWYVRGLSPGTPLATNDLQELEAALLRGRVRTDVGKRVIEDLGFRINSWTARKNAAHLRIACGNYSGTSNVCLLYVPASGEHSQRLQQRSMLTRILLAMVHTWEPDWGMAFSSEHRMLLDAQDKAAPEVGWVTYLSRRCGVVPPLPAPVRMEHVGEQGVLILLPPEEGLFTVSNPEHVALAARVRDGLTRVGVRQNLKP